METAICTLSEGHYHHGVAALFNSLYLNGFRGSFYVGYRGKLPPWAIEAKEDLTLCWEDGKTLNLANGANIHFLPVKTDYHLTNYKPDFMLELWDGPAMNVKSMFYFDPDIVVVQSWLLFEEWITCGVALSEDVNSPLAKQHPRRVAWRRHFGNEGIDLQFKNPIYVNGGFVGVSTGNKEFLNLWKKIQETMAPVIGGLNLSIFKSTHFRLLQEAGGPFMPFLKTDQDALNAAIEAGDFDISFIGKEGMGFDNGFTMMFHALGSPKPWRRKSVMQALDGRPPRKVDVEYWKVITGPIQAISDVKILLNKLTMKLALCIGRFYKRN